MKKPQSNYALIAIALLYAASTLTGCSGKNSGPMAKANTAEHVQVMEVTTEPVIERSIQRAFEVVGSLEAEDKVTLSSQASGTLDEIKVDVGTNVNRGQVIARIDARELKLRVDQAEAALRQAEARLGISRGEKYDPRKQPDVRQAAAALERARYDWTAAQNLVKNGDISRQAFDVAQRNYEQAEARYQSAIENARNLDASVEEKRAYLDLAKKQLKDVDIVTPISGVVKEKLSSKGEYLQPGKPVVTVVQINPLRLKIEAPESLSSTIKLGLTVKLTVDGFPDREFSGVIKRINPSLDERNRSLIAEAQVQNADGTLRPGMFARVQVMSSAKSTALMVPANAVVSIAGVNKVFVSESDKAVERLVRLGDKDGNLVEIIEGIRGGENVITSNMDKLQDGVQISTPAR